MSRTEKTTVILAADMMQHNAIKLEEKNKAEIAAAREYAESLVQRIHEKLPVTEPVLFGIPYFKKADIVTACLMEWGYNVSAGRTIQEIQHIFINVDNPLVTNHEKYQGPTRADEMKRLNIERLAERAKAQEIASLQAAEKMVQELYGRLPVPPRKPQRFWYNPSATPYVMIAQHLTSWGYRVAEECRENLLSISLPPS